MMMFKW